MADAGRLAEIIAYKRLEVALLRVDRSLADLEAEAATHPPPRDFAQRLIAAVRSGDNALICEMKRRSPSAGDIRVDRSPADVARAYEAGGAACLSVLTDGPSFGGSLADLAEVRAACTLPLLRKDFMIDPIQVVEARGAGADAILIILAAADDALAADLHAAADAYGLSVLIEVHDEAEFERALRLPSPLIGVNNRDLRTFVTDLATTERIAALAPPGRLLISESGVRSAADIVRLRACGARAFLVGEALMRSDDPEAAVTALRTAR